MLWAKELHALEASRVFTRPPSVEVHALCESEDLLHAFTMRETAFASLARPLEGSIASGMMTNVWYIRGTPLW